MRPCVIFIFSAPCRHFSAPHTHAIPKHATLNNARTDVHVYDRYMPYDSVTKEVDLQSVSADGSVYYEPKFMTVIVTGASGDIEGDDKYTKESPSYTGTENCALQRCCVPALPLRPPPSHSCCTPPTPLQMAGASLPPSTARTPRGTSTPSRRTAADLRTTRTTSPSSAPTRMAMPKKRGLQCSK